MNWTNYKEGDYLQHKATKTIVKIYRVYTIEDHVRFYLEAVYPKGTPIVTPISLDNIDKYWSKLNEKTVNTLFKRGKSVSIR